MFNTKLTPEEELKANAVAGSVLAKFFRGTAMVLKGTGTVIDKTTSYTAIGLRKAADGIEYVGQGTSGFCYKHSDKLNAKADDYEAQRQELVAKMAAIEKEKVNIEEQQDTTKSGTIEINVTPEKHNPFRDTAAAAAEF